MAAQFNVLAVAVSTGRVAYVYLTNGVPDKWGMSRTASKTTQKAAQIIQSWIDDLQPDLLISERVETASRKGSRVKDVLEVIEDLFENADGLNMRLTRHQSYQNKYEEAKALANAYPALKHLRPQQPPLWMPEPRNMSYFEALSFVQQIKGNPPK